MDGLLFPFKGENNTDMPRWQANSNSEVRLYFFARLNISFCMVLCLSNLFFIFIFCKNILLISNCIFCKISILNIHLLSIKYIYPVHIILNIHIEVNRIIK